MMKKSLLFLTIGLLAFNAATATDYYLSADGDDTNDGLSAENPFATVDKAISSAAASADVIYVAPGEYVTTTQWGPNLTARLVGSGATREAVVIRSSGVYRTLRMAANSSLENVTVVGEETFKADKGGSVEMNGGVITNCVIRNGAAYGNSSKHAGGNLYVAHAAALVVDSEIIGGSGTNWGGNVMLNGGTIRDCVIRGGRSFGAGESKGGNVYIANGILKNVVIADGTAGRGGNVFSANAANAVTGCTITDGSALLDHAGNVCIYNVGVFSNCVIRGGTAVSQGGNVLLQSGCGMTDCEITDGTAATLGGNLWAQSGTLTGCTVSNGALTNVSAWNHGGANIYLGAGSLVRCKVFGGTIAGTANTNNGSVYFNGSLIDNILISDSSCGGLLMNSTPAVYNSTFVRNSAYGVWGYSHTASLFQNNVLFGNTNATNGAVSNWAGTPQTANVLNSASEGALFAAFPGGVTITESDFADAENGDFRPSAGSRLVDAGAIDARPAAQTIDLDGKARQSGPIDIGCYEYQRPDMTVSLILNGEPDHYYAPATFNFTAAAQNVPTDATVTYEVNFGDGSGDIRFPASSISHVYETPGVYSVAVKAIASNGAEASMSYPSFLSVSARTVYVSAGSTGEVFPYDTPETGFPRLADAVAAAVNGGEVRVTPGVYEQSVQVAVSKAITIRGTGSLPTDVILRNTATPAAGTGSVWLRVLTLSNGAELANVTLEGGIVRNGNGGNISVNGGVVTNCVIRNGTVLVTEGSGNGSGAGLELAGSSRVIGCVITNNLINGTCGNDGFVGGSVFVSYGAKNGCLVNSLIAYNTYRTSVAEKTGTAGVRFGGSNDNTQMENCTVVSNVVEGATTSASAGIYCTSWNARLRNNVIAGNYETDRGANTSVTIENNSTFVGNITDDADVYRTGNFVAPAAAMFRNFASGDFRPALGGPLVDMGVAPGVETGLDLAGCPRVMFAVIDIGCFEAQLKPGFLLMIR